MRENHGIAAMANHSHALRSLRSKRLEGWTPKRGLAAILRDARKGALLRMRSGIYSPRRPGPIATEVCRYRRWPLRLFAIQTPMMMGPGPSPGRRREYWHVAPRTPPV